MLSKKKELLIPITVFCHRVLHVGGTVVLLLSEDHHRHIKDCEGGSIPLKSKGSHTDVRGTEKCLIPDEKTGISETVPSSSEPRNQECLDKVPRFGSLVPVECYKVSLGETEAPGQKASKKGQEGGR